MIGKQGKQMIADDLVGMIGVASMYYTFYGISLAKHEWVPWPSRCELFGGDDWGRVYVL